MVQQDNDWEELAKLHLHSSDFGINNDSSMLDASSISSCMKVFPLSYVVEKCYNYPPLRALSSFLFVQ